VTTLIVEDDFVNRLVLQKRLEEYGDVHIAVDGDEAVKAVDAMLESGGLYDLVCLDIMLPNMDGHEALKKIRTAESEAGYKVGQGSKIIMTTALKDADNVMNAFRQEADGYLVKPIETDALEEQLRRLRLIE
jgi:two-component system, chemotaxis family, chemotaxis protein CheY